MVGYFSVTLYFPAIISSANEDTLIKIIKNVKGKWPFILASFETR